MEAQILKEFGLTQNEIDIFLTIIKHGSSGATQIAKRTGLNRPYVYYALERLLEKGFISEMTTQGRKQYNTVSMEQITAQQEHKLDMLKTLTKELASHKRESDDITVEVLKGKFTIKNILRKVLTEVKRDEEILVVNVDEQKMEDIEPVYFQRAFSHNKRNNITERVIIKKGSRKLHYAKTTKYRLIDPEILGDTVQFIYQDTVIYILYGDPTYAIMIKSDNVSRTAKKQFEVFWKLAKK